VERSSLRDSLENGLAGALLPSPCAQRPLLHSAFSAVLLVPLPSEDDVDRSEHEVELRSGELAHSLREDAAVEGHEVCHIRHRILGQSG
jgi:hypothetical protein